MKLSRGLATRILIVALLIGAVSATVGFLVSVSSWRAGLEHSLANRWERDLREPALARCVEDPSTFDWRGPGTPFRIEAVDRRTGRSANPDTDAEDPSVLEAVGERPEQRGGPRYWFAVLVRGTDSGPCSVIRITLEPPQPLRSMVLRDIGFALLAVVFSALLFVYVLVVGPLRRRIRAIRASAQAVGGDGYHNEQREAADELGDVARGIHAAHERIQADHAALAASRVALEQFLADVAHDLKTPLTSLRLALEELDDRELDAPGRELLQMALADVVYAASLTENLGLVRRLEQPVDPLEPERRFDLRDVVERVAMRESFFARRRGMTLEAILPDDQVVVAADALMVEQALTNVLQNSVIHGAPGGRVDVVLRVEAGSFVCEVFDDGPGVAPEELPRLGERTFRSDEARARDPKGSGLGLAITTEVCERFGWALSFGTREPRGLSVAIRGTYTTAADAD